MKCRSSFVSNSSTSSFLIKGKNINELRIFIDRISEAYDILGEPFGPVSTILCLIESEDLDEYRVRNYNYGRKNRITLEQYKLLNKSPEKDPGVVIESCYDNSIPWSVQEIFSNFGERIHWG